MVNSLKEMRARWITAREGYHQSMRLLQSGDRTEQRVGLHRRQLEEARARYEEACAKNGLNPAAEDTPDYAVQDAETLVIQE